jgi:hypothetical protein
MNELTRPARRGLLAALTVIAAVLLAVAARPDSAVAADDNGPGSVTGTVTDHAGKPAKGVTIKVFTLNVGAAKGGSGRKLPGPDKQSAADPDADAVALQTKTRPAATTTTDDAGKFQIASLPSGAYRYMAGTPPRGYKGGTFDVEPSKTATLTIQLDKPQGNP